jgi:hypothetical protein
MLHTTIHLIRESYHKEKRKREEMEERMEVQRKIFLQKEKNKQSKEKRKKEDIKRRKMHIKRISQIIRIPSDVNEDQLKNLKNNEGYYSPQSMQRNKYLS